jgi:hypothetical protein
MNEHTFFMRYSKIKTKIDMHSIYSEEINAIANIEDTEGCNDNKAAPPERTKTKFSQE